MDLYVLIDFDALTFKILDERYEFSIEDNEDGSSEIFDGYLNTEIGSKFFYSPCTLYNFKEFGTDDLYSKSLDETSHANSLDDIEYLEILNDIESWNSHSEFSHSLYQPYRFKELILDANI